MKRGVIRPTTPEAAVQRALSQLTAMIAPPADAPPDARPRPIAYRNDDNAGGKDPYAPHCADWSYGLRTPTADCLALALWSSGLDRLQPGYKGTHGAWLHQVALLADADGKRRWCEPVEYYMARPGDWLVDPKHIGLIVRPGMVLPSGDQIDHAVVDCSPRHAMRRADWTWDAGVGLGGRWSASCRVLRYRHYQP